MFSNGLRKRQKDDIPKWQITRLDPKSVVLLQPTHSLNPIMDGVLVKPRPNTEDPALHHILNYRTGALKRKLPSILTTIENIVDELLTKSILHMIFPATVYDYTMLVHKVLPEIQPIQLAISPQPQT